MKKTGKLNVFLTSKKSYLQVSVSLLFVVNGTITVIAADVVFFACGNSSFLDLF